MRDRLHAVTTDGMDACLRGVFQAWISRVMARSPYELGCKDRSEKTRVLGRLVGENCMILGSLVSTHYQRVTDRQTDNRR